MQLELRSEAAPGDIPTPGLEKLSTQKRGKSAQKMKMFFKLRVGTAVGFCWPQMSPSCYSLLKFPLL